MKIEVSLSIYKKKKSAFLEQAVNSVTKTQSIKQEDIFKVVYFPKKQYN